VLLLEEIINVSSDWIAHGILDSVVDSFFPFLEEIEREVVDIENMVLSVDDAKDTPAKTQPHTATDVLPGNVITLGERWHDDEKVDAMPTEKYKQAFPTVIDQVRTRFSFPRPTVPIFFRRLKRMAHLAATAALSTVGMRMRSPISNSAATLWRMARTRRLVTSLTRLLATKSEVVMQIRKRLLTPSTSVTGLGNGKAKGDSVDVAIYMGDVQDHILTLQHSLNYYEHVLSQSHPTYLAQLGVAVAATKASTDKAVMILTIVSIAVACIQVLVGLFSLNVRVPTNKGMDGQTGGPHNLFGIVLALAITIIVILLGVVRRWWIQARQRRLKVAL